MCISLASAILVSVYTIPAQFLHHSPYGPHAFHARDREVVNACAVDPISPLTRNQQSDSSEVYE